MGAYQNCRPWLGRGWYRRGSKAEKPFWVDGFLLHGEVGETGKTNKQQNSNRCIYVVKLCYFMYSKLFSK